MDQASLRSDTVILWMLGLALSRSWALDNDKNPKDVSRHFRG